MDRVAEFVRLLYAAEQEAQKAEERFIEERRSEYLINQAKTMRASLLGLAKRAQDGTLTPSNGRVALGLSTWVIEWGIPVDRLYEICDQLDEFYRKNF